MTSTQALQLTIHDTRTTTSTHANIPAAKRYLARHAANRDWFYSINRLDTHTWVGAFTRRNSADHLATYTIKKVSA